MYLQLSYYSCINILSSSREIPVYVVRSYTITTTTTVLWPFVRDYPGEPVPEETFIRSSILIVIQPLSASSIYHDPQHPPCSIYVLDNLFAQPLSKSSLVYLLAWSRSRHTPYISLPSQCLLFAILGHTITACFADRVLYRPCYCYYYCSVIAEYFYYST